jgi:hypothetical protein
MFPHYLRVLSAMALVLISGGGLLLFEYPTHLALIQEKQNKKNKNL